MVHLGIDRRDYCDRCSTCEVVTAPRMQMSIQILAFQHVSLRRPVYCGL